MKRRRKSPTKSGEAGARTKHLADSRSLATLVSEGLRKKLNEVADAKQGRTYGELIAERLIEDALNGKLPAQIISKLFEATEAKASANEGSLSDKSTRELEYFVKHGCWPGGKAAESDRG